MLHVIRWIVAIPFIGACVYLALSNRQSIDFSYSPLHDPVTLPLYYVLLLTLAIGFVLGAVLTWAYGAKGRKVRREQKKTIKTMQKELDTLHKNAVKRDQLDEMGTIERPIIKSE